MITAVLVGDSSELATRSDALADFARRVSLSAGDSFTLAGTASHLEPDNLPLETRVAFVAASTHFDTLADLARRGIHLFLEWPPGSSVAECQNLARLGEEAGVEVGVSRPLRFADWPESVRRATRIDVVTVRAAVDARRRTLWKRTLEDVLDLAAYFARGASARRLDAAVARSEDRLPLTVAASLRFQNGTFCQVEVRHSEDVASAILVHLAGPGFTTSIELEAESTEGVRNETAAFLDAIAANRTPPVSVLDGLQTIRLQEKLMERLRRW